MNRNIAIERADPAHPEMRRLLEAREVYFQALYPPGSCHYLDIETMRQPSMRFFSAALDGESLGCGGVWLHEDYAEIKSVYVDPKAQGLGLAKKLMARIEEEARAAGMKLARLETGIHQPEALGLYFALGYEKRGSFGDYPTDDPNSIFMEKQLA